MSSKKLLLATALFTSSTAFADSAPLMDVTRVVTNGKGPACALVDGAPDKIEPEVIDVATGRVLDVREFRWDGRNVCLTGPNGGARSEIRVRFHGKAPKKARKVSKDRS